MVNSLSATHHGWSQGATPLVDERGTNKVEAFHKFSNWLMFASDVLQDNDPIHQEKIIKFNELLANCLIFHTAQDITKVVNDLVDEGWEVDPVDLATVTPYITSKIRRFGT
ncbi:Tn3 family transposase [Streptomyces sp. NPDC059460]|uniref:Tn3 family transposase n=1 Tax=Streptomyces sp. NPDC059460 TaxID=3346840 RepID=UPI00368E4687